MSNCKTLIFLTVIICMDTDCVSQFSIFLTDKPFTCFDRSRISHFVLSLTISSSLQAESVLVKIFLCVFYDV